MLNVCVIYTMTMWSLFILKIAPIAYALVPPRSAFAFQSHLHLRSQWLTAQRGFASVRRSRDNSSRILFSTMSSTATPFAEIPTIPGNPTWQQTMIRCRDADASLKFYRDTLGMTLIDKFDFPQYKFSLYFVTTLPEGEDFKLIPGTQEAHDYLWTYPGVTIELTHNHGTENDKNFAGYHPGNEEKDGFGHIAVSVDDVYATSDQLLAEGWQFKKKPDEGRMKVGQYVRSSMLHPLGS